MLGLNYIIKSHKNILYSIVVFQLIFTFVYANSIYKPFPSFLTLLIYLGSTFFYIFLFNQAFQKFTRKREFRNTFVKNLNLFSWFVIGICFLQLVNIQETISDLLVQIAIGMTTLNEVYQDSRSFSSNSTQLNFVSVLSNSVRHIIPLLIFLHLKYKKSKIDKFTRLLLLSSIILLVQSFSKGHRTLIISLTFQYLFFLVIIFNDKDFLTSTKRKIVGFSIVIFMLFFMGFLAITISRFSTSYSTYDPIESVYVYQGQGVINLDKIITSDSQYHKHRNLNRFFPLAKIFLGVQAPNNYDSRMKTYYDLPSKESEFSTWIGDISLDFNRYLLPIVIILLGAVLYLYATISSLNALVISYVFWIILTEGMYLFPFADVSGNLRLLILFILPIIMKIRLNANF